MEEDEIRNMLQTMEANPSMVTRPAFRANTEKWPDNEISFVESHIAYLKLHPKTDPNQYLSNLRLMLRKHP